MTARKKSLNINFALVVLSIFLSGFVVFVFQSKKTVNLIDYSGKYKENNKSGVYFGKVVNVPDEVKPVKTKVLGDSPSARWIEIDLSDQKLRAWDGSNLYLESLVSTGLPWWPTPKGEFRIWAKMRYVRMTGGTGRYAYDLPNVPYTMFFEGSGIPNWKGYGLHGTYWHNDFGRVHSHGCVNLPTPVAEKLFYWTTPTLPEKTGYIMSSDSNPGTKIVIHE